MTIIRATIDTKSAHDAFYTSYAAIQETYTDLSTLTAIATGGYSFSFDCRQYAYLDDRVFKLVDDENNTICCARIRHKQYSNHDIGIIDNFTTINTLQAKVFSNMLMLRLIKYARLHNFHILLAYGRNTDYYSNFDFSLIKSYLGLLRKDLRPNLLSDLEIISILGQLDSKTTTTSTTTSSSSTTSSGSTMTTHSTKSTTNTTMTTQTKGLGPQL